MNSLQKKELLQSFEQYPDAASAWLQFVKSLAQSDHIDTVEKAARTEGFALLRVGMSQRLSDLTQTPPKGGERHGVCKKK